MFNTNEDTPVHMSSEMFNLAIHNILQNTLVGADLFAATAPIAVERYGEHVRNKYKQTMADWNDFTISDLDGCVRLTWVAGNILYNGYTFMDVITPVLNPPVLAARTKTANTRS